MHFPFQPVSPKGRLQSCLWDAVADPNIQFRGPQEMILNAKGTVGSFGGRKLIYHKIITCKMFRFGITDRQSVR